MLPRTISLFFWLALLSFSQIEGSFCTVGSSFFLTRDTISQVNTCDVIDGNVTIQLNISSSELSLPLLQQITGYLAIRNSNLTNTNGISTLTTLGTDLIVSGNKYLSSIALIVACGRDFTLINNPVLNDFSSFSVTQVKRSLTITLNPLVTNLGFILNVQNLTGTLNIASNPSLTDTSGLSGLLTAATVQYTDNPVFDTNTFNNLQDVPNIFYVSGTIESVPDSDGIWLPKLRRVGTFQFNYIDCKTPNITFAPLLKQAQKISFLSVTNLQRILGFNQLVDISLLLLISQCPQLELVEGFNQLSHLGGVNIQLCPLLTGINGINLRNDSMEGGVSLYGLPLLPNITFLRGIQNMVNLGIVLENLPLISDVSPLGGMKRSGGAMRFANLPLVSSLPFYNLTGLGGGITVDNLPLITNVDGFRAVTELGYAFASSRSIYLANNPLLQNINGFGNVGSIIGDITIQNNPALVTLSGLCQVQSILGNIVINSSSLCCQSIATILAIPEVVGTVQIDGCVGLCSAVNNYTCDCGTANSPRCKNGGFCTTLPDGFICDCPGAYVGPTCELPIPVLQGLNPSAFQLAGNVSTVLTGYYFPEVVGLRVDDQSVAIDVYSRTSANDSSIANITFVAPSTFATGYHNLTLYNIRQPVQTVTRGDLIYYVSPELVDCLLPGMFWNGKNCILCPRGGYCPGGNRVWPFVGYWSTNENSVPSKCQLKSACPGAMGEVSGYPPVSASDGSRNTSICAYHSGYTGDFCQTCLPDYYIDAFVRCRPCSATGQDNAELAGRIIGMIGFFVVIAIGIGALEKLHLADYVTFLILVQQFSIATTQASPYVFGPQASEILLLISFINFDVNFFKPGCAFPRWSFATIFALTLLIFAIAGVIFIIAAALRALLLPETAIRRGGITRPKIFKYRSIQAMIILGSVCYLQFCVRTFQGLNCIEQGGELRLKVELSTVCYQGEHRSLAAFLWILLFAYGFGFPIWAFYIIRKSAYLAPGYAGLREPTREEKFGYLYRNLKAEYYWYRWLSFVTSFLLALQAVLANRIEIELLIGIIIFIINILMVCFLWPFDDMSSNVGTLVAGFASCSQSLFYLYELDEVYFAAGLTVFLILVALAAFLRYYSWRRDMLATLALMREKEAPRKNTGQKTLGSDEIQDQSVFRRGSMPDLTVIGDGYEKGHGDSPNNSKLVAIDERKTTPPLKPIDDKNRLGVPGPPALARIDASISYVEATDEAPTVMIMPSEHKEKDKDSKSSKEKSSKSGSKEKGSKDKDSKDKDGSQGSKGSDFDRSNSFGSPMDPNDLKLTTFAKSSSKPKLTPANLAIGASNEPRSQISRASSKLSRNVSADRSPSVSHGAESIQQSASWAGSGDPSQFAMGALQRSKSDSAAPPPGGGGGGGGGGEIPGLESAADAALEHDVDSILYREGGIAPQPASYSVGISADLLNQGDAFENERS